MKNKIYLIILIMSLTVTIKSQNKVDIVFNETQINATLQLITSARGFNIGDYKNSYGLNYWYLNLDNASIDILPNNRFKINSINFSGGVDVDLWLFNLTPSGNLTGYLEGKFEVKGNNETGYYLSLKIDRKPTIIYSGNLQAVVNLAMLITNNFGLVFPEIEVNLGSSMLPDLLLKYVKSGIPIITTNNNEVILTFEILFDDLYLHDRIIKSGETAVYTASNSIVLQKGFTVSNGANFSAKIEHKNSSASLTRMNDLDKSNEKENFSVGDSIISPLKLESLLSDEEIYSLFFNNSKNATSTHRYSVNNIPILQQNIPNPVFDNTVVRCYVPESSTASFIRIYDILGNQIRKLPLTVGENEITIQKGELPPGIYVYSLIIDGKPIDSKRMIVNK